MKDIAQRIKVIRRSWSINGETLEKNQKLRFLFILFCVWISPIWLGLVWDQLLDISKLGLSKDDVAGISGLLITTLGVTIAILIAVYAAIYAQSRTKWESGLKTLFASLAAFTDLTVEIKTFLRHGPPRQPEGYGVWVMHLEALTDRLADVPVSWKGSRRDSGLRATILLYAQKFTSLATSLWEEFDRTGYPAKHARHVNGMLLGIFMMDEASKDYRTSKDLLWVVAWLTILLAVCLIIRVAAVSDLINGTLEDASHFNSLLVVFLFLLMVTHIFGAIYIIYDWQQQVQRQGQDWAAEVESVSSQDDQKREIYTLIDRAQ